MTMRGSRWTIAALTLLLLAGLAQPTLAQPSEMLSEAIELHDRGQYDESLAKLKTLLATDPSSEDAFRLINSIEMRQWAVMMVKSGEHAAVIKQIFAAAKPASEAQAKDPEVIKGLIQQLDSEDWKARNEASIRLAADHGEYVVPHLLERLASQDSMRRAGAMEWLRRLGTQSVLPLIQALESSDPLVQAGAVTVLAQVNDPRSNPYVARMAAQEGMAADAARSIVGSNVSGDAGPMFLDLGEAYYRRDTSVVDPFRSTYTVWSTGETGLMAHEVPRDVYHLKLAEEVLYDLINDDPNHMDAKVLLGSVFVAQAVAAEAAMSGEAAGPEAPLSNADYLAASLGADVMNGVVRKAISDGRPAEGARACRILGRLMNADSFSAPNGLTDALSAPLKAVRYNAALALAHLGPRGGYAGQERLVPVLLEAVSHVTTRSVVVIDDQAETRNRVVADLNARGYFVYGVGSGPLGLARVRDYPIEDMVIIRYNLQDATVHEVLKTLRADPRTADMPVVILVDAKDMESARSLYGGESEGLKADAFIETPPVADAYEPELREKLKVLEGAREAAVQMAAHAAQALAHMDPRTLGSGAIEALTGTLKGDDRVRVPALRALGRLGDASTIEPVLECFSNATAADEVRGGAAIALARICSATAGPRDDVITAIHEAVKTDGGTAEFYNMLGTACGILPVDVGTRVELLNALRSRIVVDMQTEG
jgi:HEAT repeat protein